MFIFIFFPLFFFYLFILVFVNKLSAYWTHFDLNNTTAWYVFICFNNILKASRDTYDILKLDHQFFASLMYIPYFCPFYVFNFIIWKCYVIYVSGIWLYPREWIWRMIYDKSCTSFLLITSIRKWSSCNL